MNETTRFDPLWHDVIKNHALSVKHANGIRSSVRLFRKAAYRFARALIDIQKHHHNRLVTMIASMGLDYGRWMDDHFEVIEEMGDDRKSIMRSIEEGMTEKEYLKHAQLWIVRKRLKAPAKTVKSDIKARPTAEPMSPQQELSILRASDKSMRSELRELRRDLATALAQIDRDQKATVRMDRILRSMKPVPA